MVSSIKCGTKTIEYKIIRKPRLKHTYIEVNREGVIVKANYRVSESDIEAFILKKSSWILKHLKRYEEIEKESPKDKDNRIYYLGRLYPMQIIKEERVDTVLEFDNSEFVIRTPKNRSDEAIQRSIDNFYKEKAKEIISPIVMKWSEETGLIPERVTFRRATRRWGSCSYHNRISLNYYLMKLPMRCIEYVVVHELSHIKYKNHSADFWRLVGSYIPNYKDIEKELKEYEMII